jgi:hypothetical protein
MKFKTLNGKEVSCEVAQHKHPLKSRENCRSQSQFHLGQQLQTIFTSTPILEEFVIPESRMSLDFFIPSFKMAFEFQGKQHDQFNTLFHASKDDFIRQKTRDMEKKQWCAINGIILIEVRDEAVSVEDLITLITKVGDEQPSG